MKKFLSVLLATVTLFTFSSITFATEIKMHITEGDTLSLSEQEEGEASLNKISPRMNSDGTFEFEYSSPSSDYPNCYIQSDKFTLNTSSPRINMTINNTSDLPDKKAYLRLYGKGCGLFGKKISWKTDGKEYGYTFSNLKIGEEYYFVLDLPYYCEGYGEVVGIDKVL
ncbi:hypothetical protein EDD70_2841 [Hydrogenoanaerobacterium saccharovorans]|uniref:Uncharacterized protein n=1 Tax=Hydrogenoanaerobacterium saccharovorans TaxID=474960 RepID=A0A1H8E470_9FIRM|nr:hypothetical protein [Hydrogenoanaerobacterium saccharovorans]RPF42098.1 hypothetical protein EDD70_2841 [Hydrogenoanaerobacterium saccharovorans]SEN13588.1 hypothetical protein SAMN05216180_2857 [Hydrogenoanaerobacterium saccharovorans]